MITRPHTIGRAVFTASPGRERGREREEEERRGEEMTEEEGRGGWRRGREGEESWEEGRGDERKGVKRSGEGTGEDN